MEQVTFKVVVAVKVVSRKMRLIRCQSCYPLLNMRLIRWFVAVNMFFCFLKIEIKWLKWNHFTRGCHMSKIEQSASDTYAKIRHIDDKVGPRTFLKNKTYCRDWFQFFFYQEPKSKFAIFAGTKTIFLPFFLCVHV